MPQRKYPTRKVQEKFNNAKQGAKRRGIEFLLTFDEWWAWWQTDNRWERRGRGLGKLVMARDGDTGPYALGNIHCCTWEENHAEVPPEMKSAALKRGMARRMKEGNLHLAVRGAGHPRARRVRTPKGEFESGALAAEYYGVSKEGLYHRVRTGWHGYQWLDVGDPSYSRRRNRTVLGAAAILKWEGKK